MKETTGLDMPLSYADDAFGTVAKLDANQLQFGVSMDMSSPGAKEISQPVNR